MRKKLICIMVAVMMLMAMPQVVFAKAIDGGSTASPMWTYITDIIAILSKSGDIEASASLNSSNEFEITATLQEKSGGSWSEVDSWSETTTIYGDIIESYSLEPDVSYRLKATVKVYNSAGRVIETATKYSTTV